jgi:tubulin--tyrosine ligase
MLIGGPNWKNTPMRKFDIRMFGLAQIIDGKHFRGYFFKQGYIRTSSYKFNLHDLEDRDVHLTNDAVQDRNDEYGKYEPGNKVSMEDFAQYMQNERSISFQEAIVPQIKQVIKDTLEALCSQMAIKRKQKEAEANESEEP